MDYAARLANKPIKPTTRQSYLRTFKELGLWDCEPDDFYSEALAALDAVVNVNTRRKHLIVIRSLFPEYNWPAIYDSIPKVYQLPSKEELEFFFTMSRHSTRLRLCAYAGLRVGEACAVTPAQLSGDVLTVDRQIDQSGKLRVSKTHGRVIVPQPLCEAIQGLQPWQGPSLRLTNHCRKLSIKLGIEVRPHMLRHWYATTLINQQVNPEMVRRQLRHKNLNTTLRIYAQVDESDIRRAVEGL